MTVIDCFSKYAWAIPIRNKSADEIVNSIKKLFKSGRKSRKLQIDKSKEFINSKVQHLLENEDVHWFSTNYSDLKASIAERFNRTL